MIITQTELQSMRLAKSGSMSDAEILTDLIREDKQSPSYKMAEDAERYYDGQHDIRKHDFRTEFIAETQTNDEGDEVEVSTVFTNPNRSNERTPNPFFWIHVIQKAQYVLGKEPSISVGEDAVGGDVFSAALSKTTDAAFLNLLTEWATEAAKGGKAWIKEYRDRNGHLRQAVISRRNGIPVYDTTHDQELVEFIYHYPVEMRIGRDKRVTRTYAEWWTQQGVTYWYADGGAVFQSDPERAGVQPHFRATTYVTGKDGVTPVVKSSVGKTWERLPFIELSNNESSTSDLARYKDLIDAYDLVQSMGTNNVLDFNEFWAVLQGFGGDVANSIVKKLHVNRAVHIAGQGGNIEMKQLDLNMTGRIDWLKLLRDAIHEFGMAVDIRNATFGTAPSGVALKFQYTLLDLKANALIAQMRMAMEDHFWFITQEINKQGGASYDPAAIEVTFNKSMITNDVETVNMIIASADLVPERILMAAHPLVDDPDKAMQEIEKQRKKAAAEARKNMGSYGMPADDEDGTK